MNNIYLVFFCLEMQKDSQTFKSCSCKKFFPSVYVIGATCFNECFLLHVIIETPHFYKSLLLPCGFFNRHVVAFFAVSALKEVCILSVISTITVQCLFKKVTAKFQNKAAAYHAC